MADSNSSVAEEPVTSFSDKRLHWLNGSPAGGGGRVEVAGDGKSATVAPIAKQDFWSKTFYSPLMIKNDGQALLTPVPADTEATVHLAFNFKPKNQFDQAGIMIHVDSDTWVKAGIEWCDGEPKLSCVVTNDGFSDWSTQLWAQSDSSSDAIIRLRLHKLNPGVSQGPALVFEAAQYKPGDEAETEAGWSFVRIASLRSGDKPWNMGCFTYAPIAAGCVADFHYMKIGPKVGSVHDADASEMVST